MNNRYLNAKIYAVYRGEDYLATGTASELAELYKVKRRTVQGWATPREQQRNKGNRKIAYIISTLREEIEL